MSSGSETPTPTELPRQSAAAPRYVDGAEHLADELNRIHVLIQAYTLRWEDSIWTRPADFDAVHEKLRRFRSEPFHWGDEPLHPDFRSAVDECLQNAAMLERQIAARLEASPHLASPVARLRNCVLLGCREAQVPESAASLLKDVVLLKLLAERSPAHRWCTGLLQEGDSRSQGRVTVEQALRILQPHRTTEQLSWHAFAADAPLLTSGLVTLIETSGPESLPQQKLSLAEGVADFLLGAGDLTLGWLDSALFLKEKRRWDDLFLDPVESARLKRLADWWSKLPSPGSQSLVLLMHGPYGTPRLQAAQAFCTQIASTSGLLLIDASTARRHQDDWDQFVRRCYFYACLSGATVYWRGADALLAPDQPAQRWESILAHAEKSPAVSFIESSVTWEPASLFRPSSHHFVRVDFQTPSREIRRLIWANRLGIPGRPAPDGAVLDLLANSFQFTEGQIDDALATARGLELYRDGDVSAPKPDNLYEACRRQSARRLVTFAQRIEPRPGATLADLVVPDPNRRQLEELAERIAKRDYVYRQLGFEQRLALGHGLVVLFTGASGTGKTMAAALLASEQKVDLYKVDLAAIVSKYVGETEKNLGRLFAEAQDANAILFFDEADAVFGKRGDVEDARDRWANLEVNYLLQRVEEYTGTVILATNLRQNIDEAFTRRIQVIVDFPFPDAAARLDLYQRMFTDAVEPPSAKELKELADRFPLAGGSIKNIVLDAVFRAVQVAPEDKPIIKQRYLVDAVAREYQKLGKPVTPGDFGQVFFNWVKEDLLVARAVLQRASA